MFTAEVTLQATNLRATLEYMQVLRVLYSGLCMLSCCIIVVSFIMSKD